MALAQTATPGTLAVLSVVLLFGCVSNRPPSSSRPYTLSEDLLEDPELRRYEDMLKSLSTRSGWRVDKKLLAYAEIDQETQDLYALYGDIAHRSPEEIFENRFGPVPPREAADCQMLIALPRLGLHFPDGSAEVSASDASPGLTVTFVRPGFPGHAAGIQEGDTLLSVDGKDRFTVAELVAHLEEVGVHNIVHLEIQRDGARQAMEIRLKPVPVLGTNMRFGGGGCEDGLAHGLARLLVDSKGDGQHVEEVLGRFEHGMIREAVRWSAIKDGRPNHDTVIKIETYDDRVRAIGRMNWHPRGELIVFDQTTTEGPNGSGVILRGAETSAGPLPYIHYAGQLGQEKPHGFGILTLDTWPEPLKPVKNSRRVTGRHWHVGTFRNGEPHGRGSRSWQGSEPSWRLYTTGYYRDGKRHGPHKWEKYRHGTLLTAPGLMGYSVAMYDEGTKHGKQIRYSQAGANVFDVYEDTYENGKKVASRTIRRAKRRSLGNLAGKTMALAAGAGLAASSNMSAEDTVSFMANYSADVVGNTGGENTRQWGAEKEAQASAEAAERRARAEEAEREHRKGEARAERNQQKGEARAERGHQKGGARAERGHQKGGARAEPDPQEDGAQAEVARREREEKEKRRHEATRVAKQCDRFESSDKYSGLSEVKMAEAAGNLRDYFRAYARYQQDGHKGDPPTPPAVNTWAYQKLSGEQSELFRSSYRGLGPEIDRIYDKRISKEIPRQLVVPGPAWDRVDPKMQLEYADQYDRSAKAWMQILGRRDLMNQDIKAMCATARREAR
jgi:hypothetical protein